MQIADCRFETQIAEGRLQIAGGVFQSAIGNRQSAIGVLTPRGAALGRRLVAALGGEVVDVRGSARERLAELFLAGRPLVCVMALGIVVRILGPLLSGKGKDPPVVVLDEAGRFAISVLSGHAGANELAETVARVVGAIPVVTTASDTLGLPAVDLLGRDDDWRIEPISNLTSVAGAVVRGEPVGVFQDAGRRLDRDTWPAHFADLPRWPPDSRHAGYLIVSDRLVDTTDAPTVTYRPPTLVAGVGCRRGTACGTIAEFFDAVCRQHGLAALSLGLVTSATLKSDEPGLLQFAAERRVPLRFYTTAELAAAGPPPTPSERVRSKIGIAGVAEPAALLASGAASLVVTKQRAARVTVAIARREAT